MPRESIKDVLMRRDGLDNYEADKLINEAKQDMWERISEGDTEAAYEICMEYFGLEPDYLEDLI